MSGETCGRCGQFVPQIQDGPDDISLAEHECETAVEKITRLAGEMREGLLSGKPLEYELQVY